MTMCEHDREYLDENVLAAKEDPVVREAVETMDLTVISEKEIMQAAGVATM